MEENLFPSQLSLNSRSDLEEERRLFYVALTRAKETCTITYATTRFKWGSMETTEPSRFIDEIDKEYLHFETPQRAGGRSLFSGSGNPEKPFTGGLNRIPGTSNGLKSIQQSDPNINRSGNNTELKVGYNVVHDRFGKGKITKLEGAGSDRKATIFFPHHGAKVVLLRFANLTVVDTD